LSVALLLMGVAFLLLGVAGGNKDALAMLIGDIFFLAFGLFVLIFTILIGRKTKAVTAQGEARAKQLLAEGKMLPIPPLPAPSKSIAPDTLLHIESYANQLNTIPWGDNPRVPADQVAALFNQTVATTRRITGDWSRLSEPVQLFAAMPRPWSHVGAAEVMFRLSFVEGRRYAPVGLRQGVRFTTRANCIRRCNPTRWSFRSSCSPPARRQPGRSTRRRPSNWRTARLPTILGCPIR
jgi:hypothetical protein